MLDAEPADVLRSRDARKLGVDPEEPGHVLIARMAEHPELLQRPIAVRGDRAVVGRPPDRVLELVEEA